MRPFEGLVCLGLLERPLEARHDTRADRPVEPQRVADHERIVADLHGTGIAKGRRDDRRGHRRRLEHGDVVLGLLLGHDRVAVVEPSANVTVIVVAFDDHVERGQDVALVGDDDAAADAVRWRRSPVHRP